MPVLDGQWQGNGPAFAIDWGGRRWVLDLAEPSPGLQPDGDDPAIKFLSLSTLSRRGWCAVDVFSESTLAGFEIHQGRVQATYAPDGWGEARVRATWGPLPRSGGMDLEIQLGATSVGELKHVEVGVVTDCVGLGRSSMVVQWVEPRDLQAAALSYDGRESVDTLRGLWTMPIPDGKHAPLSPWLHTPRPNSPATMVYVELAQGPDVARRILTVPAGQGPSHAAAESMHYALFGHDLEKGVILRGRLRGHWVASSSRLEERETARALCHDFLAEPPPLGP